MLAVLATRLAIHLAAAEEAAKKILASLENTDYLTLTQ
jgi:hypothetical protein